MKEYLLELKVKNNYLSEKMKEHGIKSQAELARYCDISQSQAGVMMNMKETPYNKSGKLRPYLGKVLNALLCSVEDIYPPEQMERSLDKNIYRAAVQAEELKVMLSSEASIDGLVEYSETVDALERAIDSSMNERHAKVLKMRFFEERTLEQVAKELGVGRVRIKQMEQKGLRVLRSPTNDEKKKLHECVGVPKMTIGDV